MVVWCLDPGRQQEWAREKMSNAGVRMDRVEDAIRDPPSAGDDVRGGGQRVLGRAGTKVGTKKVEVKAEEKKEPFRRVVEKPFWKVREPEE